MRTEVEADGRRSGAVFQFRAAIASRAVDAAKDLPFFFDAVADDTAAAMRAARSQRVNRTLEAIENMCSALHPHLEAFVVIVSAEFTLGHDFPFVLYQHARFPIV